MLETSKWRQCPPKSCLKNKHWICRVNLVFIHRTNRNNNNNNDDNNNNNKNNNDNNKKKEAVETPFELEWVVFMRK